jgi:hypothetical protein
VTKTWNQFASALKWQKFKCIPCRWLSEARYIQFFFIDSANCFMSFKCPNVRLRQTPRGEFQAVGKYYELDQMTRDIYGFTGMV